MVYFYVSIKNDKKYPSFMLIITFQHISRDAARQSEFGVLKDLNLTFIIENKTG